MSLLRSLLAAGVLAGLPALARSESPAPYAASPVIASIDWAPTETIIRKAQGGDNWPVTWGPDDAIYSTWGDGRGFEPFVERKLSCGFVCVTGAPDRFRGENIRSAAEQLGEGRKGKKGWGILSVEGRLYLWFGHADQKGAAAQLAWSDDLAKTWTFADWRFDELGLIGFVNYGRDYQGARDEYIYAYSHDGPRADTPADRFVLLRAPKDKLTERSAWEIFERLDESGEPVWARDFNRRGSVFENKDACLRSAMTWCAGLKRYLWWQQIPQPVGHKDRGDTRFDGGFGIYDAPEPWGPWTTAYHTTKWDVGPGEHADFPARWMSPDGRTLHLVFSGEDSFSVRQATVRVKATPRLRFGGFSGATGGYSGIRGTSDGLAQLRVALLNEEEVKKELGLTEEQAIAVEGLRERAASLMPSGTSLSHLSPEEQRKAVEEIQAHLSSTAK